jgi:hypothetical protein
VVELDEVEDEQAPSKMVAAAASARRRLFTSGV